MLAQTIPGVIFGNDTRFCQNRLRTAAEVIDTVPVNPIPESANAKLANVQRPERPRYDDG